MSVMRAKVRVTKVEHHEGNSQKVVMMPVSSNKPYGKDGENEDNTYARYTPSGELWLGITNPNLFGVFKPGMIMYVDFTEAEA